MKARNEDHFDMVIQDSTEKEEYFRENLLRNYSFLSPENLTSFYPTFKQLIRKESTQISLISENREKLTKVLQSLSRWFLNEYTKDNIDKITFQLKT